MRALTELTADFEAAGTVRATWLARLIATPPRPAASGAVAAAAPEKTLSGTATNRLDGHSPATSPVARAAAPPSGVSAVTPARQQHHASSADSAADTAAPEAAEPLDRFD